MKNLFVLFVLSISHIVFSTSEEQVNPTLPQHVIPISYKLKLVLHLKDKFDFDGVVKIRINVREESKNIILHARNLTIPSESCSLLKGNEVLKPSHIQTLNEMELFVMNFEKEIEVGEYDLVLSFRGNLISADCGLCAQPYEVNNRTSYYAISNTSPIGTRRIFPCFDEPHFKTVYELTVVHEKRYHVISNTPLLEKKELETEIESVFEKTPALSTFSFMVVVSDFVSASSDNERFVIWNRQNAPEQGFHQFLQNAVVKLEEYFGLPLPSTKLNVFVIPENGIRQFSNWGIIGIRDSGDSQNVNTQTAASIAKLLIDQWIGQLVSPASWTDQWISLGISLYLAAYINEQILPGREILNDFIYEYIQIYALQFDKNNDVNHALSRPRNSPKEILKKSAIEDVKGAALIRMIQHMLTEKVFQEGLQEFLKNYSYKAAGTSEFFDSLNAVASRHNLVLGSDVKTIMNPWFEQKGYPVVNAIRNYADGSAQLTQERLTSEAPNGNDINPKYSWWIPINYMQDVDSKLNETTSELWMTPNENSHKIDKLNPSRPLILNKHQTGFYRVNYDISNWKLIAKYLNTEEGGTKIPVINRVQLMTDALDFADTKRLLPEMLLEITEYLQYEKDKNVWTTAFRIYEYLLTNSINARYKETLHAYLENKMTPLKKIDPDLYNQLHMHSSCIASDSLCLSKALSSLEEWVDGHKNPTVTESLLCLGMKNADRSLWDKLYNKFLQSNENDSGTMLAILACTGNPETLTHLLSLGLSKNSTLRLPDIFFGTFYSYMRIDVDTILSFLLKIPTTTFEEGEWRFIINVLLSKLENQKQLDQFKKMANHHKLNIRSDRITKVQESLDPKFNWFISEDAEVYFKNHLKST